MAFNPSVSIIINTDARVDSLKRTLESLPYLDYPSFEVCVVRGPTEDGTQELLRQKVGDIKVARCPDRNLGASRNIGIAMAAGEIVAFLDDDSIPEPEWLSKVVQPFVRADVAACGGFLHDNTGVGYQWRFGTIDRFGVPNQRWRRPPTEFNFPFTANFPHVMANSAFRKSAVLSVGGFDEQYTYFLDETDLICRLVDDGWHVVPIDGAAVHHKFRSSQIRDKGVIRSWYAIIKSKMYFTLVNAHGHHDVRQAQRAAAVFIKGLKENLEWGISRGLASTADLDRFGRETESALADGLQAGLAHDRKLFDQAKLKDFARPFRPFAVLAPVGGRKTLCLLSKTYPPGSIGGIGRHIHQLARSLARFGHQVHVLTQGSTHDVVDFEDGVWVHRICPKPQPQTPNERYSLPPHIWDYSATMLAEAKRIAAARPIDVVYAPIWDCEGIAFLFDGSFPLITGLYTTLMQWLATHPYREAESAFMESFIRPMLAHERILFEQSDAIVADSRAIVAEIEAAYGVHFEAKKLGLVPIGLEDWAGRPAQSPPSLPADAVRVLFVGRLEERKGIDVLLSAAKEVLRAQPRAHLDVVGQDTLIGAHNATYRQAFECDPDAGTIRDRVRFHGEVEEAELRGFYRACDIFVAPSRFESFGLILLEAMMYGKPVIGCRAGGMSEIVEHGVSGLLAEPGSVSSLSDCLLQLIEDPELRRRLGAAGRRRYETAFGDDDMARRTLEFFDHLPAKRSNSPALVDSRDRPGAQDAWENVIALRPVRRIALISSILERNDAVSASVRDEYHILKLQPAFEVAVFAACNDWEDVPCNIVQNSSDLLLHPAYIDADLLIWHFGVYYEMFNAVFVGNGRARQAIRFHNVTPIDLVPAQSRPLIEQSMQQCNHLRVADEVWADSAVNAEAARAVGVANGRLHIVPIVVDRPACSALASKQRRPIDILFVGRFVASKGVLDLIRALAVLPRSMRAELRVTLAGNLSFSDREYLEKLQNAIAGAELGRTVQIFGSVDDTTLGQFYKRAHILAIPSYHEGFCKPVIEGLRAGCIPVGYACYNLPEVAGGLGCLVPAGDVAALAQTLDAVVTDLFQAFATPLADCLLVDRGRLTLADFDKLKDQHVQQFTSKRVAIQLRDRVDALLKRSDQTVDVASDALCLKEGVSVI